MYAMKTTGIILRDENGDWIVNGKIFSDSEILKRVALYDDLVDSLKSSIQYGGQPLLPILKLSFAKLLRKVRG